MEDDDEPVDAAAGLLLLRSVGASGMENLGERGSWSRPDTSHPGDRDCIDVDDDEDAGRLARSGMKSKTLMSRSLGVLSSALPKFRSIADRFGLGTRARGDGVTCATEGVPAADAASPALGMLRRLSGLDVVVVDDGGSGGSPLLGCLNPAESGNLEDWNGGLAAGAAGAVESGNSSLTCTLEADDEEEEDTKDVEGGAAAGAVREVGDVSLAPMVMSLGLFWELVGVSHEFESERSPALLLETCFMSLNILRRFASMPSHGDLSPMSETRGRLRGGSGGSGGGVVAAEPLTGKSAPVAESDSHGFGVVSMSLLPPPSAASRSAWPLVSPAEGVNRGVGKPLGEIRLLMPPADSILGVVSMLDFEAELAAPLPPLPTVLFVLPFTLAPRPLPPPPPLPPALSAATADMADCRPSLLVWSHAVADGLSRLQAEEGGRVMRTLLECNSILNLQLSAQQWDRKRAAAKQLTD